tara:strand:- start:1349 stop:1651 length:303 start_codon:yes stop_codon:yes gene_type:complete
MKKYKITDPEMIQAGEDLAKLSNLSERVISNDKDLFEELSTIQSKLCEISSIKAHFMQRYEDILEEQYQIETKLAVFQHEMLHSFELVFRYYKTKKKGFK